jgi:hypothetical protein
MLFLGFDLEPKGSGLSTVKAPDSSPFAPPRLESDK